MSVTTNSCPSRSAVGRTTVTCCEFPSTDPHLEGLFPMTEQPSQAPTWIDCRRMTPSTFQRSSLVSPGTRLGSICTVHHAEAWKSWRPGTSTCSVNVTVTVRAVPLYVAYPMVIPEGVVIGTGLSSPSVPSSSGTETTIESPEQ